MKPYLIIFAIILAGTAAKAQTVFKTNESISSQLKNGTVPGLVYSKATSVKKETTAASINMESSGKQIRNNAVSGGVSEEKIAETKPQSNLSAQARSTVPLASDKPAEIPRPVEKVEPPKSVQ